MAVFRVRDETPESPESGDSENEPATAAPENDAQQAQTEEGAPEAGQEPPESLASVFNGWQWDLYQTVPPSKRLEDRLAELLSGVESWKAEVQTSTGEMQSRLFAEMTILQAKLEGVRNIRDEGQAAFKHALRTIWRETQQVSSAVEAWTASTQTGAEDRAKLIQALESIAQRVAEAQDNVLGQQQLVAGQLAALVEALKATQARADVLIGDGDARVHRLLETVDAGLTERHEDAKAATEHLLGSLKERLALLQSTTALVAEGHDQLRKSLEAQGAAVAAGLEATQAGLVRSLEAIDERLVRRHDEVNAATVRLQESVLERLGALETTVGSVREGLGMLEAAAGSIVQGHDEAKAAAEKSRAGLMEGLQRVDAGVAEALTTVATERTELKGEVAALSESVKQLRSDVKEAATQSEIRVRQHLESVESRTLAAISDLALALLEEQRATKLELQNRVDRGVREPLKSAVSLLSKQLSDVQATVERTFDTLRNADLTLRIDSVDALLDPRYRKGQPYDLVELPSPGPGTDGPPGEPAGD